MCYATMTLSTNSWSHNLVLTYRHELEGDKPQNVNDLLFAMEKLSLFNPALNALKTQKVNSKLPFRKNMLA